MPDSHLPPLQRWLKQKPELSLKEISLSAGGALLAILLTATIGRLFLDGSGLPFLVASMGASAVIIFAAPTSTMAQPWALLGGHMVSGLIGVTCARYIPDTALAAAVAAAGAILGMHYLRCMHPPGGATALMPIAAPAAVGHLGYSYLLTPVGIDVILMLALALLINQYLLRRPYPLRRPSNVGDFILQAPQPKSVQIAPPFNEDDLKSALQELDTYIDVGHEDLRRIYSLALLQSYQRKAGNRSCAELMEATPGTLAYSDELSAALAQLQQHGVDGLPVVDRAGHLQGLLSIADFVRHAQAMPGSNDSDKVQNLIRHTTTVTSNKPEVVGQIMDSQVTTARQDQPLSEAIEQLAHSTAPIIPVLDDDNKLIGILRRRILLGHLGIKS